MTPSTYIDRRITAVLRDANGVEVETISGTLCDVSEQARRFMLLSAGDPDGLGDGGSVEFTLADKEVPA